MKTPPSTGRITTARRRGTQSLHWTSALRVCIRDAGMHDLRDVGGTKGGLGMFFVGLGLAIAGAYLLMDRVTVHGGYWGFGGSMGTSFGITLIPVILGVGTLFYDGKSWLGWILFLGGLLVIFAGIIANLNIHFRSTSLFNTLVILGLIGAGIGLIIRSTRPVEKPAARK